MTTQNARLIGNLFKNLLDIDMASNDDVSIGSCIRLRVDVDITKPMLAGFTNKRPDGSLERVRFRFERAENRGKRQEYGPWMRVEIFSSKSKSQFRAPQVQRPVLSSSGSLLGVNQVARVVSEVDKQVKTSTQSPVSLVSGDPTVRCGRHHNLQPISVAFTAEVAARPSLPLGKDYTFTRPDIPSLKRKERWRSSFGFHCSFYVPLDGLSGGLALWWKDCLPVQILQYSKRWIDVMVSQSIPWHASFVYGDSKVQGRISFVDSLRGLDLNDNSPWLIIGDFNICNSQSDKWGARRINNAVARASNSFLFYGALEELPFKGHRFTWSNKQYGQARIMARLDKAVTNSEWRSLFSKCQLIHGNLIASDHHPLILSMHPKFKKAVGVFHFDLRWMSSSQCEENIKVAWNSLSGTLVEKLSFCRNVLSKWSNRNFGNSHKKIQELSHKLDDLLSSLSPNIHQEEVEEVKRQLSHQWRMEELYWYKKSRVNWLSFGDKNTKFFHASAIQRRQRNQIVKIRIVKEIGSKKIVPLSRRHWISFITYLLRPSS
ncbi:hypothetical protein GH714_018069 [Hevea brasiliensis]|uniref:Endonuclease/exonuclease/phosphatase domain-containing protein n=1 Tax=Hevea brasiliensis TaxID=3981 RepID=A0A6A6K5F1_HEVBR|nr:hypothetical protein GH714_018069 [Hevea brasiliensis]